MFYSQFILAKKGPLGTIWIAAHLERKLRKNQVADTDIGVSVDSIIFPEVPIALRLSSHLLLGVVRIYSRKVNYLFDDCSEALLKIKQAFRSTAVDLPPEESTAPYHSITLPETFDLDDFELPDHDIFQGNYIDHHISNKEQITLQDTMDGLDYSTSKFGLDERFGDGDTSQIGLDLDQDLLLNILPAPENARDDMDLDDVPNTSSHPDESIMNENNGKTSESAEEIQAKPSGPEDGAVIQSSTVDNGINELLEYAQAPATPGLVEEPNLSNQKTLACDDRFESKNHLIETVTHENPTETLHSSPPGEEDMVVNHDLKAIYTENGHMSSEPKIKQSELESNSNLGTKDAALGVIKKPQGKYCEDVTCQSEEPLSPNNVLTSSGLGSLDGSDCLQVLHACNSDVKVHDTLSKGKENAFLDQPSECPTPFDKGEDVQGDSVKVQGNFQVTDTTIESVDVMNQSADKCQQVQENYSGLNEKIESSLTKHDDEVSFAPPVSELPAVEKLRSVPERHSELPTDLLPDTTPEKVVSAIDEDGTGVTTRQKRSFTESTLTIDSLHTAESSGKNRLRKTAESVPGDEDLLSSILVGRRSSILNLKPTPTQTEVVSMKRPQTASRSITYKRKVLMDDTMVLHGDTIREQLVSTEDIRRVRKKAPCTRQEFWMIQKQFLEEDIVYDPISTGMSIDLVCLHNQAYELSGISITRVDESVNLTGSTQEMQPPWDKSVIPNAQEGGIEETNVETQLSTTSFQIENQPGEGDTSCVSHDNSELQKGESAASLPLATSLEQAHISEMEVDGDSGAVVEAAEHSSYLPIESSSPACVIPVDITEIAVGCAIPLAGETSYCSNVNYEASSLNQSNKEKVDHSHVATVDAGDGSPLHVKSVTLTELSSKEADNSGCVDDIELFESLTAPEAHGHDLVHGADTQALDNYGSNEAGPSLSVVHYVNIKELSPIGGQNDIFKEFDEPRRIANGTTDAGSAVVEDYNGTNYITAEHDTGFLNVDDDQEEDGSYMPSIEETRSRIADNSGWSSRSRAVGKYLQIMFDKEAEQGKNVIPMDNLLTGKSRKEASRMFFETLVLKTRDYIQLEQTGPFNNINMHPKSRLMKSDF